MTSPLSIALMGAEEPSQTGFVWEGVTCREIARLVKPRPEARTAVEHIYGGYAAHGENFS